MQGSNAASQWYGYIIGGLATLLAGSWLGVWIQGLLNRKKTGAETDALQIGNYKNAEDFFQKLFTKLAVAQFKALKLKQEIDEKDEAIKDLEGQKIDWMAQSRSQQEQIRRQYQQIGEQAEEIRRLKCENKK